MYMPMLLRTWCWVHRRDHRAYDDDSRNQLFREAPMAARKKAAKRGKKAAKRGAKKAAKRGKKK